MNFHLFFSFHKVHFSNIELYNDDDTRYSISVLSISQFERTEKEENIFTFCSSLEYFVVPEIYNWSDCLNILKSAAGFSLVKNFVGIL